MCIRDRGTYTPTLFSGRPAVSTFNDALGYYPGIADEGDGTYWSTVDWDASAVVPAKDVYSVKAAPGYPGYHIMYRGDGWFGFWGWDEAGYGNPGDNNVQYGWVVELVDEGTDGTWGQVMIYNQRVTFTPSYAPAAITGIDQGDTYTITYQTVIENTGAQVADTVCLTYTLDSALTGEMTVVKDGTVVLPGTLELPAFCATTMWPGDVVTVTVEATGAAAPGTVDTLVAWSDGLASFGPFSQPTTIGVNHYIFLPLVLKNAGS